MQSTTPEPKFNGIPASAPLFRNAPLEKLSSIVVHLSSASFHFADDSGTEWGLGLEAVRKAAAEVNNLKLGYTAIEALHKAVAQLVTLDQFIDAILKDARK